MYWKGTLGNVTKEFDRWIEKLGMPGDVGAVQQTAFVRKGNDPEEGVKDVGGRFLVICYDLPNRSYDGSSNGQSIA